MKNKKTGAEKNSAGKFTAISIVVMLAAGIIISGLCDMTAYGAGTDVTSSGGSGTVSYDKSEAGEFTGASSAEIDISGSDRTSEEELSELRQVNGAVLFADSSASLQPASEPSPATDKVVLKYSKVVHYEGYSTHYFKVKYDGKTKIAYCVQPKLQSPSQGTKTAVKYNSRLMTKALYYSYGYPGYDKRTRSYVSKKDIDDYDDDYGAYALSHMILSYIYDKESVNSDAFTGVSSSTKKLVKNLTETIENKWPEPPSDASLALSRTIVAAAWDSSLNVQKTPEIKLKGHSDNRIYMTVPKYCTMVKTGDGVTKKYTRGKDNSKKVKVFSGDSFYFTAPASVTGSFRSPQMEGAISSFQPYLIKVSGKQDIVFCGVGSTTSVSFQINWVKTGKICLVKKSSDSEITSGSGCYSLKGAVYGLYSRNTGKLVKKLTTDAEGRAEVSGITRGNYYLRELTAPAGYEKDKQEHSVKSSAGTVTAEVSDKPETAEVDLIVRKSDKETGNHDVAYGASLENAQYTVKYYSKYYNSVSEIADSKPDRTWVIRTDKDGKAGLDEEHFVSGDRFFSDDAGNTVLPLGTVTIQETKAPEGYLEGDEIFLRKISNDENSGTVSEFKPAEHKEQIIRGDAEFTKVHGTTGEKLSGIQFEITSEDTGETITAVTDSSGKLSTVSGKCIGKKAEGDRKNDKGGNLPYGDYVINEVRCEKNKGLQLVRNLKFSVKENNRIVDLGEVKDHEIKIGTSASDDTDGDRTAAPRQNVSITDRVSYEGLEKGAKYTIKGVLMDKSSGKPVVIDGEKITASKEFTVAQSNGSADVVFRFDGSELGGKELVVFESLYENGMLAAEHKDMNSTEQTILMEKNDSSADTGDAFPLAAAGIILVVSAAVTVILLLRKQKY